MCATREKIKSYNKWRFMKNAVLLITALCGCEAARRWGFFFFFLHHQTKLSARACGIKTAWMLPHAKKIIINK